MHPTLYVSLRGITTGRDLTEYWIVSERMFASIVHRGSWTVVLDLLGRTFLPTASKACLSDISPEHLPFILLPLP